MAETDESLALRLVESERNPPALGDYLKIEASIVLDAFTGRSSFWASRADLTTFAEQLRGLDEHLIGSARIECGSVEAGTDIIYFGCHIEALGGRGQLLAQLSLGTVGSNEVLQRLHVGLRVEPLGLSEFRRSLQQLLATRTGTAVLRGAGRSAAS